MCKAGGRMSISRDTERDSSLINNETRGSPRAFAYNTHNATSTWILRGPLALNFPAHTNAEQQNICLEFIVTTTRKDISSTNHVLQ